MTSDGASILDAARSLRLDLAPRFVLALEAESINSLLIKGPATALHLYAEDPSLRAYSDIDVLIPADRLDAATAVLDRLGFHSIECGLTPDAGPPTPRTGGCTARPPSRSTCTTGSTEFPALPRSRRPLGGPPVRDGRWRAVQVRTRRLLLADHPARLGTGRPSDAGRSPEGHRPHGRRDLAAGGPPGEPRAGRGCLPSRRPPAPFGPGAGATPGDSSRRFTLRLARDPGEPTSRVGRGVRCIFRTAEMSWPERVAFGARLVFPPSEPYMRWYLHHLSRLGRRPSSPSAPAKPLEALTQPHELGLLSGCLLRGLRVCQGAPRALATWRRARQIALASGWQPPDEGWRPSPLPGGQERSRSSRAPVVGPPMPDRDSSPVGHQDPSDSRGSPPPVRAPPTAAIGDAVVCVVLRRSRGTCLETALTRQRWRADGGHSP